MTNENIGIILKEIVKRFGHHHAVITLNAISRSQPIATHFNHAHIGILRIERRHIHVIGLQKGYRKAFEQGQIMLECRFLIGFQHRMINGYDDK